MLPPTARVVSSLRALVCPLFVLISFLPTSAQSLPDATYPSLTVRKLAFGSCHSRKAFDRLSSTLTANNNHTATIWDAIASHRPDAFLWAGDAVYPPRKLGDAPVGALIDEYDQLRTNHTLGYARTMLLPSLIAPRGGIHGTYDDHDYGGNDRGKEMADRSARRDAYLDFLNLDAQHPRRRRNGLYSSVSFGTAPCKVLVLFLDTRWGRDRHCIPSIAATVPLGAVISCVTRWISAGLNLPDMLPRCRHRKMLEEEQWTWLEEEVAGSDAQVHIVVSSVQILTTNPAVESWGQFPEERAKLLRLVNGLPGLVLISGDVHHADISDALAGVEDTDTGDQHRQSRHGIVEVTSSGLTHSCVGPFYGFLCAPILRAFSANRFRGVSSDGGIVGDRDKGDYFYTGRNYGTMDIEWSTGGESEVGKSNAKTITVKIHDESGATVLSTGAIKLGGASTNTSSKALTSDELSRVKGCVDGHLRSFVEKIMLAIVICCFSWMVWRRRWSRWMKAQDDGKKDQ